MGFMDTIKSAGRGLAKMLKDKVWPKKAAPVSNYPRYSHISKDVDETDAMIARQFGDRFWHQWSKRSRPTKQAYSSVRDYIKATEATTKFANKQRIVARSRIRKLHAEGII